MRQLLCAVIWHSEKAKKKLQSKQDSRLSISFFVSA